MEILPGKPHLTFLISLSLLLIVHARLNLHPSDSNALVIIHRDLGVNGQLSHPCNTTGIFCERRIANHSEILRITRIVIRSRRLTGFISPAIGRLSELKELSLPNNLLVDQIPSQIVDCTKLETLNLKNNKFSGEIPVELSELVNLRVLDISSNKFSGNLSFLTYFPNMEKLSLADNLFTGKIPVSIRSFRNLQFYNFSGNNFIDGRSPVMNLPKRFIFAEDSMANSPATAPTASKRIVLGDSPAPSQALVKKGRSKKKKVLGWVLGFLAGTFAGIISGLIVSLLFKLILATIKGGGRNKGGPSIFSKSISKEDLAFLEKEDGLASMEIIGRGGCGEVYRAELPPREGREAKVIAIKKIVQPQKDASELTEEDTKLLNKKLRQIRAEIQTVGQIRHRNLLPLLAHMSQPEAHYLVYEYMKNGSLQDTLTQVSQGTRELDWLARHRIAVGVASGLEYLHTSIPRIIHRDLKPANILLDDDMEARIADFGLAEAIPDANTHVTASNVAGTVGYISPEYHQTLKFTDKCDIYSFGVLLGVLVMGKLPSDEFFQHTQEISLVKWMRSVMSSETPNRAIDPKLVEDGYEEQMLLVLKIACFCTLDDPKQRPNSKNVSIMLSQIQH